MVAPVRSRSATTALYPLVLPSGTNSDWTVRRSSSSRQASTLCGCLVLQDPHASHQEDGYLSQNRYRRLADRRHAGTAQPTGLKVRENEVLRHERGTGFPFPFFPFLGSSVSHTSSSGDLFCSPPLVSFSFWCRSAELAAPATTAPHMTKQDAIKKLDALTTGDSELAHSDADSILLDYLRDNGAPEVAEAFSRARDRVSFWYA